MDWETELTAAFETVVLATFPIPNASDAPDPIVSERWRPVSEMINRHRSSLTFESAHPVLIN
jgi:hypothetical protein